MAINFGGLATGLDTASLISSLMKLERRPLERLETEKKYQSSRLDAFKAFDQKLRDLQAKVEALDSSDEVRTFKASAPSEEFFSLSANSHAAPGSFQVEVKNLAQIQKEVSQGYASKADALFGTGTITINGRGIDYSGDSLTGLMEKINAANTGDSPTGVSASIINDGTTGYRLVLTGKDAGSPFTLSVNETVAGTYAPPAFSNTQVARRAAILVDNIEIQSDSNVFDQAIPGVTLTLNKANESGVKTTVTVDTDKEALKDKIQGFVNAYNDLFSFVAKQGSADWGKDSTFRAVKRRLQDLIVNPLEVSGSLKTFSQLGIETNQRDGTLSLKSSVLEELVGKNLDDIEKLLAGETDVKGLAQNLKDYLKGVTSSENGILAAREDSTGSSLRKIDQNILRLESRLEQREKSLRAQFDALEQLVSVMNSQSTFLAQQINSWTTR